MKRARHPNGDRETDGKVCEVSRDNVHKAPCFERVQYKYAAGLLACQDNYERVQNWRLPEATRSHPAKIP
jgi:hypothetical protein